MASVSVSCPAPNLTHVLLLVLTLWSDVEADSGVPAEWAVENTTHPPQLVLSAGNPIAELFP